MLLFIGQGFDRGESVEPGGGKDAAAAVAEEGEGAAHAAEAVVERRGDAGAVILTDGKEGKVKLLDEEACTRYVP